MGGAVVTPAQKRIVIEVLMCASDERAPSPFWIAAQWDVPEKLNSDAYQRWADALPLENAETAAVEAAYRLIETSADLKREWFGKAVKP